MYIYFIHTGKTLLLPDAVCKTGQYGGGYGIQMMHIRLISVVLIAMHPNGKLSGLFKSVHQTKSG